MLEIDDVVGEGLLEELGLAIRERDDEPRALRIMPHGESVDSGIVHGPEPNTARCVGESADE